MGAEHEGGAPTGRKVEPQRRRIGPAPVQMVRPLDLAHPPRCRRPLLGGPSGTVERGQHVLHVAPHVPLGWRRCRHGEGDGRLALHPLAQRGRGVARAVPLHAGAPARRHRRPDALPEAGRQLPGRAVPVLRARQLLVAAGGAVGSPRDGVVPVRSGRNRHRVRRRVEGHACPVPCRRGSERRERSAAGGSGRSAAAGRLAQARLRRLRVAGGGGTVGYRLRRRTQGTAVRPLSPPARQSVAAAHREVDRGCSPRRRSVGPRVLVHRRGRRRVGRRRR